jgi:hypothetical protein
LETTTVRLGPTIPIFPLTGALLLPRGLLPLNIFEPRYLAMVDDALGSDRLIGMVQPVEGRASERVPPVYETGCAGRISSFEETDDGRYLITLTGICRFRVGEELPTLRGYRRVKADWDPFRGDPNDCACGDFDRPRLLDRLAVFFERQGITANWDAIKEASDERLVTSLAMVCPFEPSEKQALLEAPTLTDRAKLITTLVEMAVLGGEGDDRARH